MRYFSLGLLIGALLSIPTYCAKATTVKMLGVRPRKMTCHAVLVKPDVVMTALHCIWKTYVGNNPIDKGSAMFNGYKREYTVMTGMITNVYNMGDLVIKDGFVFLKLSTPLYIFKVSEVRKTPFHGGEALMVCYRDGYGVRYVRVYVNYLVQSPMDKFYNGSVPFVTKGCSGGGLYRKGKLIGLVLSSNSAMLKTQWLDTSRHYKYVKSVLKQ